MMLRLPSLVIACLLMAACSKEPTNADGKGPANADAVSGHEDPPVITRPGIPPGGPTAPQPTDSAPAPAETPPPAQ